MNQLILRIANLFNQEGVRYEVCGGLRRGLPFEHCDGLTLVVDELVEAARILGHRPILSPKAKKITISFNHNKVVLLRSCMEEWGAAILAATGNPFFTVRVRGVAKEQGMKLNFYGLWHNENLIAGLTEEQIFDALGLKHYKPTERNFNRDSKLGVI